MATALPAHKLADKHKGYEIYLRNPGFEFTPVTLRKIASFVVKGTDKSLAVFAFAYSMLEREVEEDSLLADALAVIRNRIDEGRLEHHRDYTYQMQRGGFIEVSDPKWWISSFA